MSIIERMFGSRIRIHAERIAALEEEYSILLAENDRLQKALASEEVENTLLSEKVGELEHTLGFRNGDFDDEPAKSVN